MSDAWPDFTRRRVEHDSGASRTDSTRKGEVRTRCDRRGGFRGNG